MSTHTELLVALQDKRRFRLASLRRFVLLSRVLRVVPSVYLTMFVAAASKPDDAKFGFSSGGA